MRAAVLLRLLLSQALPLQAKLAATVTRPLPVLMLMVVVVAQRAVQRPTVPMEQRASVLAVLAMVVQAAAQQPVQQARQVQVAAVRVLQTVAVQVEQAPLGRSTPQRSVAL